jgi:hypothetical protein
MSMAEVSFGAPEHGCSVRCDVGFLLLRRREEYSCRVLELGLINEIRRELADHERHSGGLRSRFDKLEAPLPG